MTVGRGGVGGIGRFTLPRLVDLRFVWCIRLRIFGLGERIVWALEMLVLEFMVFQDLLILLRKRPIWVGILVLHTCEPFASKV